MKRTIQLIAFALLATSVAAAQTASTPAPPAPAAAAPSAPAAAAPTAVADAPAARPRPRPPRLKLARRHSSTQGGGPLQPEPAWPPVARATPTTPRGDAIHFCRSCARRRQEPNTTTAAGRAAGLAGLGVADVSLRGVLMSQGGYVGMLQGSDDKTYIVRPATSWPTERFGRSPAR